MLNETFAALADPTRRSILAMLAERDHSVGEVVDQFSIAQSAISRHLNVLESAKLIERRRKGQRRICRLRAEPFAEVDNWMQHYRAQWKQALRRLDKVVARKAEE